MNDDWWESTEDEDEDFDSGYIEFLDYEREKELDELFELDGW